MSITSLTCPSCKKVLKSNAPVPAGKVVKCPGCQNTFKVQGDDQGAKSRANGKPDSIAEKKGAPKGDARPSRDKKSDRDEGVRSKDLDRKKSRLADDDDDRARKKSRRAEDDEDLPKSKKSRRDEDDDDRPKSKKSRRDDDDDDLPKSKKSRRDEDDDDGSRSGKKKGGSKNKMLILAGGGVGLVLLFVVTAFLWPGFLRSTPTAKGDDKKDATKGEDRKPARIVMPVADFTRLMPEDSDVAVGVTLGGGENAALKNLVVANAAEGNVPEEYGEFMADMDFVFLAGNAAAMKMVVILQTAKALDADKVQKMIKSGKAEKLRDKSVFRPPGSIVHLPSDKSMAIFFGMSDDEVGKLIETDKCLVRRPELLEQVKKVHDKTLWAVVGLKGNPKIGELIDDLKKTQQVSELAPVAAAAKLACLTANLESGSLKLEANLTCNSADDAKKAEDVLSPFVKGIGFMANMGISEVTKAAKKDAKLKPHLEDLDKLVSSFLKDLEVLSVKASGPELTAQLTLQKNTLDRAIALVDAVKAAQEAGQPVGPKNKSLATRSRQNLQQIVTGMHIFHDAFRSLPPPAICSADGKPLLSWRVAILPFIEQQPLYAKFKLDEPWDSPHNIQLLPLMPAIYAPPGLTTQEPHTTFYQVFVGPGAAFELTPNKQGASLANSFTDGTSNVWGVVEAAQPVPWTKPADLEYDQNKPLPKFGGVVFREGFHAAFMSAEVRFFSSSMSDDDRRAFILRASGKPRPKVN